ncbi:MAG: acetoin dehydrogenase [Pseudonocardia sp.]|uniref:alpha-ketoacid dehydrogenase subunit beta n=1 Tax=unclassified Pseudonocardia TaxID=2619320 RepID=UPI000868B0E5|nr:MULTISPECIES: transketolase C-terminal domain-containing protein [unclassified Pseudonocardia]MBN9111437.1 acetoin dehydrogenase [Pseudonocardia sp.]ODV05849.1 MAG: acetoin dehydrogenase [Pseudonocardia sp. SCN 73-27]
MPDTAVSPPATTTETRELTYGEAVNAALRRCLDELPETLLFGEDIAKPGGVFGVTRGLRRDFGDRVFDTPISESAILGSAVGAAMLGRRPIVEIMWVDFSLVAFDQVVNQLANVRYVSRGELTAPVTIRTQQGSAPGACAQHSQSLEALFLHVPGLRVCMPWTAQDAYDLLVAAVHSDDPVLVIENRTLYPTGKGPVRLGGPAQTPGGLRVRREGTDATVVTWGAMTARVLEGAATLADEGISLEVLETVWLNPFPSDQIVASAGRTGALAVVHEANVTGGFGAEVVARVAGQGVPLRVPPLRLGLPDTRVPAAPSLVAGLLPGPGDIAGSVRAWLRN